MAPRSPYLSLYDILGIPKSASADEVRKAYRKKALETHPDRLGPHASERERQAAEARFHLIHNAFETLSDPHRRKAYDVWGSRLDPHAASQETAKRMADRDAWARNLREEYEQRRISRDQPSNSPRAKPLPKSKPPTMPLNSSRHANASDPPTQASSATSDGKCTSRATNAASKAGPSQNPATARDGDSSMSSNKNRAVTAGPAVNATTDSDSITIHEEVQPLTEEEEKLIAEILEEVRAQLPPEYEERRKRALQKKAERERAETRRHTVPV